MTLYMVGGLPGSGKSTLARAMVDPKYAEWFEADDYFVGNDGVYRYRQADVGKAHKDCQARVEVAMQTGAGTVVVANTFSRQWEREPYRQLARKYGYRVVWIAIETDLTDEELARRNVHGVDVDVIAAMRSRWEQ